MEHVNGTNPANPNNQADSDSQANRQESLPQPAHAVDAGRAFAIRHPEALHIEDETGARFLGCEQEWYGSLWQRRAGCGPTVASNMMLYLHRTGALQLPFDVTGKTGCLQLMNAMWNHVTPSPRGVNSVRRFADGLHAFSERYGYRMDCASILYPKATMKRPSFPEVVSFIADGLVLDCPIGFLNLSNGDVTNLDSWHWVTLVRMEVSQDGGRAWVEYYDGNRSEVIDLRIWCDTTRDHGGFVHFRHIGT